LPARAVPAHPAIGFWRPADQPWRWASVNSRYFVFIDDIEASTSDRIGKFRRIPAGLHHVAKAMACGAILGWVSGRSEIGPRALGNRSILAAPFSKETLARLNKIKRRESYRPIAPVCLAGDATFYFDLTKDSHWMLYFSQVKDSRLGAVTHVDGSARPQTVSEIQNPLLHQLLEKFKEITGVGVLCNTSLNFFRRRLHKSLL
jgi:hydroxymethyl cephem carbamoyltransferase